MEYALCVGEKTMLDVLVTALAVLVITLVFTFYTYGKVKGVCKKVDISVREDGIFIPRFGWKQKDFLARYEDIEKTRWAPWRYGTVFGIELADGRKAIFWSLAFGSLSEYREFKSLVQHHVAKTRSA